MTDKKVRVELRIMINVEKMYLITLWVKKLGSASVRQPRGVKASVKPTSYKFYIHLYV